MRSGIEECRVQSLPEQKALVRVYVCLCVPLLSVPAHMSGRAGRVEGGYGTDGLLPWEMELEGCCCYGSACRLRS